MLKQKQAAIGHRLIAQFIGNCLIIIIILSLAGVGLMISVFDPKLQSSLTVALLLIICITILTLPFIWEFKQISKTLFGMLIVDKTGKRASWMKILVRTLCKMFLSIFTLLGLLHKSDPRMLHDKIAGTYVIVVKSK